LALDRSDKGYDFFAVHHGLYLGRTNVERSRYSGEGKENYFTNEHAAVQHAIGLLDKEIKKLEDRREYFYKQSHKAIESTH